MFIVKYFSQNEILILYFRHSVKALVKEPAISDGRIRPGDKLISANGQVIVIFKYYCHHDLQLHLHRKRTFAKFYTDIL